MNRREFLMISATSMAGLGLQGALPAFGAISANRKNNYNIVILGDTHFDTEPESVYHSNYDEKIEWLNRVQRAEFARNGEMWRGRCPRLLKRAACLVDKNTKMAFQMGDLIQGDCGSGEVHRKMLDDVMNSFKKEFSNLPFVTVVGNHDIRGVDAEVAYKSYMPQRISEETGKKILKTTFSFPIGNDSFIFLDFNTPDADEIERLLDETRGCRHTFIVTHGPVFPSDDGSTRWILFGGESKESTELRRYFRRAFAQRNAIVLCGHTHKTEFMDWWGDGGRITQMTMNSVWSRPQQDESWLVESPLEYGSLRKKVQKKADGSELMDESALFEEYLPGLKAYRSTVAAGSYKMDVTSKDVVVDFYAGDSTQITHTFKIR